MKRLFAILSVVIGSAVLLRADRAPDHRSLVNVSREGLAIQGYDPVAYFTEMKPVKGSGKFTSRHEGATYRFASAEHKRQFDAAPGVYAPAYGGFCGYAASVGKVRPANPLLWSIVDGRLIVQHTQGAANLWERDVRGNKSKADRLWPRLVELKAGMKNPIDSLLGKSVLGDLQGRGATE